MGGDGLSKLIAKACFLAALTTVIFMAGNSQASLQFKQMKDRLIHGVQRF